MQITESLDFLLRAMKSHGGNQGGSNVITRGLKHSLSYWVEERVQGGLQGDLPARELWWRAGEGSSSKGNGNQGQGPGGLETPRQGLPRAVRLPPAHPLAPAALGFLYPHHPTLSCCCGTGFMNDSSSTWVSCPAVSPPTPPPCHFPSTWSSSGTANLAPHHLGWQPRALPASGECLSRKELGLCQPQVPPTLSCLCDFAHPFPLPRDPLSAGPVHPPRTTFSGRPCLAHLVLWGFFKILCIHF